MILVLNVAGNKVRIQANIIVKCGNNIGYKEIDSIVDAAQAEVLVLKLKE